MPNIKPMSFFSSFFMFPLLQSFLRKKDKPIIVLVNLRETYLFKKCHLEQMVADGHFNGQRTAHNLNHSLLRIDNNM